MTIKDEQFTLRQVIQQRFDELEDHIAALDSMVRKRDDIPFHSTYDNLRLRYEIEAMAEGIRELESRVVSLENYQTVQRFVLRQVITVAITALLVTMAFILSWYM